jgi:hypothetical protein
MILKIAYDGWKFIDNIKEPHIRFYQKSDETLVWDEAFLLHHDVMIEGSSDKPDRRVGFRAKEVMNEPLPGILSVSYLKDGQYYKIMTDCTVYLMNDEGKTIERLN